MAVKLEWKTEAGLDIPIAIKQKGKISVSEIQYALKNAHHYGGWTIIFTTTKDDNYVGWGEDTPGDAITVYPLYDGEPCPVCCKALVVDYCPECGAHLKKEAE